MFPIQKLNLKKIILIFLIASSLYSEQSQNVTGRVIDAITEMPLPSATVQLLDSTLKLGAVTNSKGEFTIKNVPLGRLSFQASYIGYSKTIITEQITTAKSPYLVFKITESITNSDELLVTPKLEKDISINPMTVVSSHLLSVEEASRYAGGFDDPARLASAFAGVASSVSNNAIVIRGNAPKFLQWNIEGVEIPSPNHFANLSVFGGGGLTALSSNLLDNSDFLTGAFPAQYSNALSGVFDLRMRNGNNSEFEHSFEVGVIGIDLASEGPLGISNNSSYLINYRYSTLGLLEPILPEDAQGTNYQDLAFKLSIPTDWAGNFSIWGIGLIDNSGQSIEADPSLRVYYQDIEQEKVQQYMGTIGLINRIIISNSGYINSSFLMSQDGIDLLTERLDTNEIIRPERKLDNSYTNYTFKSFVSEKLADNHLNRTGLTYQSLGYNLDMKARFDNSEYGNIAQENGRTSLLSVFSNSKFSFDNLNLNLGINYTRFTLNGNSNIEPRIGANYTLNSNGDQLSFGYGLHSRLEPINIYFIRDNEGALLNQNLDLTKSHHFVLGYKFKISNNIVFKIEPYYQKLYDIPVIPDSSYALINLQNNWFSNDRFVNTGEGRNIGVDLTLEKYIDNGLYYLITASFFDSKYRTGDSEEWFNTRFNNNILFNALIGKEFYFGESSTIGVNLRASLQGGDRFSAIDLENSIQNQDVVYDESTPFSSITDPYLVSHLTINYKWNTDETTQELSMKVINASMHEEFYGFRYNIENKSVDEFREALVIANLSYKIWF